MVRVRCPLRSKHSRQTTVFANKLFVAPAVCAYLAMRTIWALAASIEVTVMAR